MDRSGETPVSRHYSVRSDIKTRYKDHEIAGAPALANLFFMYMGGWVCVCVPSSSFIATVHSSNPQQNKEKKNFRAVLFSNCLTLREENKKKRGMKGGKMKF